MLTLVSFNATDVFWSMKKRQTLQIKNEIQHQPEFNLRQNIVIKDIFRL